MPKMLRFAAAGVAAVTAATLCGCTSSSGHSTPASATAAAKASSSGPTLVQNPVPTKLANQPAVRKDVVQTSCTAVPGGWGVAGTVKNSAAKPRTYKIVAFFTTVQATTLDFAQASVKVAPGQTAKWTASKKFAAQKQMRCVLAGISAS